MRIRIGAENERSAAIFAQRFLPFVETATGQKIVAAVICQETITCFSPEATKTYIPDDSWQFQEAGADIHKLAHAGINFIILSEQFLFWKTDKETINDDLEAFEQALIETGMSVIYIGSFEDADKYKSYFADSSQWPDYAATQIAALMAEDYRHYDLILPWGALPYFIIEPIDYQRLKNSPSFRALVGFQPWTYEKLQQDCLPEKFPFIHWLPDKCPGVKVGPVPCNCLII